MSGLQWYLKNYSIFPFIFFFYFNSKCEFELIFGLIHPAVHNNNISSQLRSIDGRVEPNLFRPKIVAICHDLVTSNY